MAEVPSELVAEVRKLERYHAENPQGRYFVPLANAYRRMGEVAQAEVLLREGLRRHPDYLSAHIVLGRCLADRGATQEAVGEFRYVLSVDPQNLIALRSLGELAVADGRSDEAARWYRELLAVDPMNDDARQALESLEAATPAAGEETTGGAGEWERSGAEAPTGDLGMIEDPLGWGTEAAGSDAPAGAGNDAAAWGEISLDAGAPGEAPREESAPDPFGGVGLGGIELTDAATAAAGRAEPWSAGGTGGWDPLSGGTIDLDRVSYDVPDELDEDEVVTETIAELYARQGFYDRAADVYRELIRRRGGDPALEDRLHEMELRAAGRFPEEEPAAAADAPEAPDAAGTPVGDVDLGRVPDLPLIPARSVDWIEAAPEAVPAADAFASSFEMGFGGTLAEGSGAGALPSFAGAQDDEVPPIREATTGEERDTPRAEPAIAAVAPPSESEAEPETAAAPLPDAHAVGTRSVREYLASLAAWSPGASVAETAPAGEVPPVTAAAPAPVAEAGAGGGEIEDLDDDMPWLSAPVSGESEDAGAEVVGIEGLLAQDSGGAAAGADEEPYPWEIPTAEEPAQPPPSESAFSFEEFFMDMAEASAPEASAPPPPPAPPAPEPSGPAQPAQTAAGSAGEDDEDLESFQAWLQSLKR